MKLFATALLALLFLSTPASAQTADGQFTVSFDGATLEVRVEIQGNPVQELGQSTLRFTFNPAGLSFPASPVKNTDYIYSNYDGLFSVSPLIVYDSDVTNNSGEVSVNIDLTTTNGGQDLPSAWTNAVTLFFDILDVNETTNFQWTLTQLFQEDGVTAYSIGTFANLDIPLDASLPVELAQFAASVDGRDVVLNWDPASESNLLDYEVQSRSADESVWKTVGAVVAAQELDKSYSYRLEALPVGTHRFRLAQRSADGLVSFSSEVEAVIGVQDSFEISSVFPNPFTSIASVTLSVQSEQYVDVDIYNLLGQKVRTAFSDDVAANQTLAITLDGTDLPSGTYLVRARGEEFVATRTVSVVR